MAEDWLPKGRRANGEPAGFERRSGYGVMRAWRRDAEGWGSGVGLHSGGRAARGGGGGGGVRASGCEGRGGRGRLSARDTFGKDRFRVAHVGRQHLFPLRQIDHDRCRSATLGKPRHVLLDVRLERVKALV